MRAARSAWFTLRTHTERRVSGSGNASRPAVWGDYVVWLEDYLDAEMTAGLGSNVFLYCLSTGQTQQLTRGERADLPSVGDRFVAWHTPLGLVNAYDLAEKRLITVDDRAGGRERRVYGAYTSEGAIAWYWGETNGAGLGKTSEARVIAPCAR